MRRNRLKYFTTVSIALAVTICMSMLSVVFAADISGSAEYSEEGLSFTATDGSWTAKSTWTISKTDSQITGKATKSLVVDPTNTLTITNNSGGTVTIGFEYVATGCTATIGTSGTETIYTDSQYEAKLIDGQTLTISVQIPKAFGGDATINVNKFSVVAAKASSLTLEKPENGSYTISTTHDGGTTSATSDDASLSYVTGNYVTMEAKPTDEAQYQFRGWTINDVMVSSENPFTTNSLNDGDRINAVFTSASYKFVYNVGKITYSSWSEAVRVAKLDSLPIVLNQDYSLPGDLEALKATGENFVDEKEDFVSVEGNSVTYTLPKGVTFIIPYDSENIKTGRYDETESVSSVIKGSSDYELTINSGIKFDVNGIFVVNAKQYCVPYRDEGVTGAKYGKLVLDGTMTVNSGGELHARGYIVDSNHSAGHAFGKSLGKVYAMDGSSVYVFFQIRNHRGGTATGTVNLLGTRVMPITVYYLQNIMVYTEYVAGSSMHGCYAIDIDDSIKSGSCTILSGSSGLFVMHSGSALAMDYDYANDQLIVNLKQGTVDMKNISLTFPKMFLGQDITIDTASCELPISDNIQIYVGEYGNKTHGDASVIANVNYPIKLLPGASINVMGNGQMNITSKGGIYLYAAKKDGVSDYNATWSDGRYRVRLYNDLVKNSTASTPIESTKDAAINVYGTVVNQGILLQSPNITAGVNPMTENAVFDVQKNVTSGTVDELANTEKSVTENQNWEPIDGLFVDVSSSNTDYVAFSNNAVGTGTYKSVDIDGERYWYKHCVTFVDKDGNEVAEPVYIVGDSVTFNASDIGKYVIRNYSIDLPDGVTVSGTDKDGNADINYKSDADNGNVSAGWEHLTLSGVSQDLVVTLTMDSYDYRVNWIVTGDDSKNRAEYIDGDTTYTEWTGDSSMAFTATFTPDEGSATTATGTPLHIEDDTTTEENEAKSRYTVSNIDTDIQVELTVSSNAWLVTWNVTGGPDGAISWSEYVAADDGEITYTVDQPTSGWYVIEDNTEETTYYSYTEAYATGINNRESFTLENVTGNVNVDINLTKYDCKVQLTTGSNTAGEAVEVDPIYVNFVDSGGTVVVTSEDISTETVRNIFEEIKSISPETTYKLSDHKDVLTISNVTSRLTTVTVMLRSYDYKVEIVETEDDGTTTHLKQYITAGTPVSYEFAEGITIDSVTSVTTATVIRTDAAPDVKARLDISAVSGDTTINVETHGYDHIVTFVEVVTVDGVETTVELLKEYTTADRVEYAIENATTGSRYYISNAVIKSGTGTGALSEWPAESLAISCISGHPTIQIMRNTFEKKVTWINSADTTKSLEVDFLDANDTEASLDATQRNDAGIRYVAKVTGYTNLQTDQIPVTSGEIITVNNVAKDASVTIELLTYTYKIDYRADNLIKKTQYVDANGKNVTGTASIGYTATKPDYITNCVVSSGTAKIDGSSNTNANVADGWEGLKLTDIGSNVTVDLTLDTYDHKVTWTVKTSLNGVSNTATSARYITGDTAECSLDAQYTITDITASGVTTSGIGTNVATVSDITDDVAVKVVARDYLYKLIWVYDGEDHEQDVVASDIVDGVVKWTMPEELSNYVVTAVNPSNGTATFTNKTVSFTRASDATPGSTCRVEITLAEAEDGYTYYFGNMAYKYSKNKAYYTYDNGWKLMEQYTWSRVAGSKVYTVYEESEDGVSVLEKLYPVPNGSVLLVNNSNQIVKATVVVTAKYAWIEMALRGNDGTEGVITQSDDGTNVSTITITLMPGDEVIVTGDISGTPDNEYETASAAGEWSVKLEPTD